MESKNKAKYEKGWRAGQSPTPAKVEAADARRENIFWYLGFNDAAGGCGKYESIEEITYSAREGS